MAARSPRPPTTRSRPDHLQRGRSPMRSWSCRSSGCSGTASSDGESAAPARCGVCSNATASWWPAARSNASCASKDFTAFVAANSSSPRGPTPRRSGRQIVCNTASAPIARTSCGWSTSRMFRRGQAWHSPHSSPTSTHVGSWGGGRWTGCPPTSRWTPSKWRSGFETAPARTSPESSNIQMQELRADSIGRRNTL